MERNKLATYLKGKKIDVSKPSININSEMLEEIDQNELYRRTYLDHFHIHTSVTGTKKEYIMRNCFVEGAKFSRLQVKGKVIFDNVIFRDVKFAGCGFSSSVFYHCSFIECYAEDTSFKSSCFVNCSGMEDIVFERNDLSGLNVFGSEMNIEELKDKQNTVTSLKYEKERVIFDNAEEVSKEMIEIIENEIYEKVSFDEKKLRNHLYHKCSFISCTFDKSIDLKYSLDFKECTFREMELRNTTVEKITFDKCTFDRIIFESQFLHCSFYGAGFADCTFTDGCLFHTCNFSKTNARSVINLKKVKVVNSDFDNGDEEVNIALNNLYEILKMKDVILQNKIGLLDEGNLSKDVVLSFMATLDDREYIDLITVVGTKRREGDSGKITGL